MTESESPGHAEAAGWVIDDEGLTFPENLNRDATYDVLINEQHVWSLLPSRDATPAEVGGSRASWPAALHRRLRGHAEVAVRHHASGETLMSAEHLFAGDAETRVDITDGAGRPLIIDKYGRLTHPLSHQDADIVGELLDTCLHLLGVLRGDLGVPAFVAYGTLLGAARGGELIGHDNDVDLAYVSSHPYPVDVVREGLRIERALRDHGYSVRRGSGARMNVRIKLSDGSLRGIDIFTAHWVEGVLYMPSDTGFELPREAILPLGEVELHGRRFPAPARAEELLAATYGPTWRTPDPAFKYDTPRWLNRRINGWFGGLITHRKHWDTFYSQQRQRVPKGPSPFARWVADSYPSDLPLVDVGCGTARDSLWFAVKHGRTVTGLDYNAGVLRRATTRSERRGVIADFHLANLYDTRAVLTWGAILASREDPCDVYARFTLHSLSEPGQENLMILASMALRRGGRLFLEFRTPEDAANEHLFTHRRHYVSPQRAHELVTSAGGHVVHQVVGTGLAPFEPEDPVVCRTVAEWKGRR